MSARLPARALLVVALLASAMAATACGSRLETGELVAANGALMVGSPAEVRASEIVRDAYVGKAAVA